MDYQKGVGKQGGGLAPIVYLFGFELLVRIMIVYDFL